MKEKSIEAYFCKKGEFYNAKSLKLILFCGAGFPDRTVLFPDGHIFFVEFKTETGRFSRLQKYWQKILTDYGFRYYVCRSRKDAELILTGEFVRCYS